MEAWGRVVSNFFHSLNCRISDSGWFWICKRIIVIVSKSYQLKKQFSKYGVFSKEQVYFLISNTFFCCQIHKLHNIKYLSKKISRFNKNKINIIHTWNFVKIICFFLFNFRRNIQILEFSWSPRERRTEQHNAAAKRGHPGKNEAVRATAAAAAATTTNEQSSNGCWDSRRYKQCRRHK